MQPIIDIFYQFNWVDILIVLLILRFIFVSLKEGLAIEFFKLVGTFCACFFALHYFSLVAGLLNIRFSETKITTPSHFLLTLSYFCLACCAYGIFVFVRLVISRLIVAQINPVLSRWGGVTTGIVRGFLTVSLILFFFLVTGISYFRESIYYSVTGSSIVQLAPATYQWFWKTIISKFSSSRGVNPLVEETLQFEPRTKKN